MIHLLDDALINKIAAGEVIERPASVVKELTENSIDAGATSVIIEIKDGGTSLIRIKDNGRGIEEGELKTAFLRHATSKLSKLEDLDDIMTFGFRGEALSSVASVAQVEMTTKTKDAIAASYIQINGGKVEKQSTSAGNNGTEIIVRNIFYNTPARRKFLKKPAVEGSKVSEIVNRLALAHPEVAIKFINNGNCILQTTGSGNLKENIFYIYGREAAEKMIAADFVSDGYRISGLIGKPELNRGNRSYENFFIGSRYVVSKLVRDAVEDAYKGRLMVGKYPVFILNLTVPPGCVDVNVHPAKLEVRFSDENAVYDLVYNAVSNAFADKSLISKVTWDAPKKPTPEKPIQQTLEDVEDFEYSAETTAPVTMTAAQPSVASSMPVSPSKSVDFGYEQNTPLISERSLRNVKAGEILPKKEEKPVSFLDFMPKEEEEKPLYAQSDTPNEKKEEEPVKMPPLSSFGVTEEKKPSRKPFFTDYIIIGQIFRTYWIVEQAGKMYMIDQHAAHERVLFEEFSQKIRSSENMSQLLLDPVTINVTESEKVLIEENRALLEKFGFEFDEFGDRCYAVRSVPYLLEKYDFVASFRDIVDSLAKGRVTNLYDNKMDEIALMSCKAAVKGNEKLSVQEARYLIESLLKLENPFCCPHGRPTIIEMSKYEIEKKFKRIQDK